MAPPERKRTPTLAGVAVAGPQEARDAALLYEVRRSNHLLAVLAVRGLPQRDAIVFLDGLGFRPVEIASALGVTRNTVSIALHRLRKATAGDRDGTPAGPAESGGTDGDA